MYICKICLKIFPYKYRLERHKNKKYPCKLNVDKKSTKNQQKINKNSFQNIPNSFQNIPNLFQNSFQNLPNLFQNLPNYGFLVLLKVMLLKAIASYFSCMFKNTMDI